jgi:hypothetical protein
MFVVWFLHAERPEVLSACSPAGGMPKKVLSEAE